MTTWLPGSSGAHLLRVRAQGVAGCSPHSGTLLAQPAGTGWCRRTLSQTSHRCRPPSAWGAGSAPACASASAPGSWSGCRRPRRGPRPRCARRLGGWPCPPASPSVRWVSRAAAGGHCQAAHTRQPAAGAAACPTARCSQRGSSTRLHCGQPNKPCKQNVVLQMLYLCQLQAEEAHAGLLIHLHTCAAESCTVMGHTSAGRPSPTDPQQTRTSMDERQAGQTRSSILIAQACANNSSQGWMGPHVSAAGADDEGQLLAQPWRHAQRQRVRAARRPLLVGLATIWAGLPGAACSHRLAEPGHPACRVRQ